MPTSSSDRADFPTETRADWRDRDLASRMLAVAARHADRLALSVDGRDYDYRTLFDRARRIAALLSDHRTPSSAGPLCAVVGTRTFNCFAGVLGALLSGAAYVPLNPKFPIARTGDMLRAACPGAICLAKGDLPSLSPILAELAPMVIVVADLDDTAALAAQLPRHRICGAREIAARDPIAPVSISPDALAYVMFTSGSTGAPKGVMLIHRNVTACIASFGDRYQLSIADRLSQNFDLTFDLSVFDMFAAWLHGASLHVAPAAQQACPNAFVVEAGLTVWFSVPSLALFMQKMRVLKPGAFPSLRWSLFCGERLPVSVAEAFAVAAPASVVENLYGPTEVTIACTVHAFDRAESDATLQGSVPIGRPLPGLAAAIVDEALAEVAPGQSGELCFAGSQVARGYLDDPKKTGERFVAMPWDREARTWYRTGDLAVQLDGGALAHLGRTDDQVKIRGYRVELGEVEFAIRRLTSNEAVAAVAVPARGGETLEIVAFVAGSFDEARVRDELKKVLPAYMHPARFVSLNALQLSGNGKIDRGALRRILLENNAALPG